MINQRFARTLVATLCAGVVGLAGCESNDSSPHPLPTTNDRFSTHSKLRGGQAHEGVYIVVLEDRADVAAIANSTGVVPSHVYRDALNGFAAALPPAAIEALSRNPNVRFIEPDRAVHAVAQTIPTGAMRMGADTSAVAKIDGINDPMDVNVAVIDTGIDLDHEDLNVVGGAHFTKGKDNGGDDDNGHGSHVAGTIAALDNGIGSVGIAPGANLYAVKVLNKNGSGTRSGVIAGIDWVTATRNDGDPNNDIAVANMSLGGSGSDDTDGGDCLISGDAYHIAICNAVHSGIIFVVAAGNESDDAAAHVPAAYDEVITVSALADFDGRPGAQHTGSTCRADEDDSFANFSNFGADVDIIAPGVCIFSTWQGGGYNTISGTSMASPHVAGAAALYVATHGVPANKAEVDAAKAALIANADASPCATADGICSDDPDGIQEGLAFVGAGCTSDSDCDDGNVCNGSETCSGGACTSGTPLSCPADADPCTTACDPISGCQEPTPVADATPCPDGDVCNGDEICNAGVCTAGTPLDCDDGNSCTVGSCDASLGCVQTWAACSDAASDGCCAPSCDSTNDLDCSPPTCTASGSKCKSNAQCCSGACYVGGKGGPRCG